MIKKTFIIILLFICSVYIFPYEKIVDWENNEIETDKLIYDGNFYLIDKNKSIDKKLVAYIVFNLTKENVNINKIELEGISANELIKRAEILNKDYPDAPLHVLYDDGIEKLDKDGSRYTRSRYSVKINNEKMLSEYSILSFYYIKGDYESNIVMARSISPDGTINYLKKSDITFTKPSQGLSHFSGRKDEKILKAKIPGVRVGSIVDFEFEVTESSPEDENQFYASWYFGGEHPVFESRLRVIIPENKNLYWAEKNFAPFSAKPEISVSKGYKTYLFRRGKCPPIINEKYGPPTRELYPLIYCSLFKDMTYLSNWLAKFMKERMIANEKMEDTVNFLLDKAKVKTEEEKIAVLYRFVQEFILYRSIKTSLSSGFSGHPAAETYENKYGDCIDKAILFSTLLGIAGIKAYPVIVTTNDNPKPFYNEIGVVSGNHAITEIHLQEKIKKIIYLDSTSSTYNYPCFRYDDQGIPVWNPILNTVRYIDPIDAKWNTSIFEKEITLMENGNANISSRSIYSGDWEAGLRQYFLSIKQAELESVLNSIVARDYPGSILNNYNFSSPSDYTKNLSLEMEYEAFDIAKKTGNFYIMNIPVNYDFEYVSLETRKYPVKFQTTEGKINKIKIEIPDKFKLKGLPDDFSVKNKFIEYTAHYELEGNTIIFEDHFKRNAIEIEPDDYKKLRNDILLIDNFIKTPLIYKIN